MAKASWVLTVPESGSGDASVAVSSNATHTGRVARETDLTFVAANCDDVVRHVIQAGKPEFVSVDSATVAVSQEGGTITITGTSNSTKIDFDLGSGDIELTLPDTYLANSVEVNTGEDIPGDPGATAEFPFSMTITVPANTTTEDKSAQIVITDSNGDETVITVEQTASEPYLEVEEGDIQLDYLGTEVDIYVSSNTNWTIQ